MSEWKVLYDINFWGSAREDDPAFEVEIDGERPLPTTEHAVNQTVNWCGETWKILSVYTCEKGMVIDYCKQTDPEELAAFVRKFRAAGLEDDFDEELFERMQLENPSAPSAMLDVKRGEVRLCSQGSSGLHYMPEDPELDDERMKNDPVALACMEHYGLDDTFAYHISRAHFLWDEGHIGDLSGLTARFYEMDAYNMPGEHITLTGEKQDIPLVHPVTGEKYTLHIDHIESNELSKEHLEQMNSIRGDDESEILYPTHFETVCYAVEPETGEDRLSLRARVGGDSPIIKEYGEKAASSVAVIGGASGPTSVFVAGKVKSELRLKSICSPLFFEPTQVRDWYVVYRVKQREDLCVDLMISDTAKQLDDL